MRLCRFATCSSVHAWSFRTASSNSSTGTRLGAVTSRSRSVSQAERWSAARAASHGVAARATEVLVVMAAPSVAEVDGEDDRRELRELRLVEEDGRAGEELA